MCNFMGFRVTKTEFIKLKQVERELGTLAALEILKDGFLYGDSKVLKKNGNEFDVVDMHWEFIPPWIKNKDELITARKQGIPWLNATSEKLLESKMFKPAVLKRRCIVLANHFFEWRHYQPQGEKKPIAYPYVIEPCEGDYMFMAGIYSPWFDHEKDEWIDTFAIITTKANELMSEIHNKKMRQPTILTEDLAWEWLMEDLGEQRIKEIASFQMPSDHFIAHTIRKDFKSSDNPLEPFDFEELPPIDVAL
jgi:putative SOS response-associated peptidase YedK